MTSAASCSGVGVFGCGIESQMESWYRFLIQPDPYADSRARHDGHPRERPTPGAMGGRRSTIIQERHDFLRPDSLVAVVVLSDENDSEIDVRSLGGLGYFFMRTGFAPPHGTSACATNPLDRERAALSALPATRIPAASGRRRHGVAVYSAVNDWGYDPNLRHVHMRQKYGIDPQFPVERYFYGLTSPTSCPTGAREYPAGANELFGVRLQHSIARTRCTPLRLPTSRQLSTTRLRRPLSAADATTLCSLPAGHAYRRQGVLRAYRWRSPPALALHAGRPRGEHADERRLGEDPRDRSRELQLQRHRPAHVRVVHAAAARTGRDVDESSHVRLERHQPSGAHERTEHGTDPVSGREWITDVPVGVPSSRGRSSVRVHLPARDAARLHTGGQRICVRLSVPRR